MKRETIISFGSLVLFTVIFSATLGNYIYAGRELTLWSFAIVHMAGYFFFLVMPVELLVPVYLKSHHWLTIYVVSLVTATLPLVVDYAIGYLFPNRQVLDVIGKERYERLTVQLEKYGKYIIFFFGLTPLSEPFLCLVAGIVKFSFRQTILYSFLGMAVKYAAIIALTQYGYSLF